MKILPIQIGDIYWNSRLSRNWLGYNQHEIKKRWFEEKNSGKKQCEGEEY